MWLVAMDAWGGCLRVTHSIGEIGIAFGAFLSTLQLDCFANGIWAAQGTLSMLLTVYKAACI
jgi:hypothetical protein